MYKKILNIILVLALTLGLTGCWSIGLEFPVSKTGFPIGFTRLSDGAQIYLGMTREEIGKVLGEAIEPFWFPVLYDDQIVIQYSNSNVTSIGTLSENWAIADGIFFGDSIQNIINSEIFFDIIHSEEQRVIRVTNAPADSEYLKYVMVFTYDDRGYIEIMSVSYASEVLEYFVI